MGRLSYSVITGLFYLLIAAFSIGIAERFKYLDVILLALLLVTAVGYFTNVWSRAGAGVSQDDRLPLLSGLVNSAGVGVVIWRLCSRPDSIVAGMWVPFAVLVIALLPWMVGKALLRK